MNKLCAAAVVAVMAVVGCGGKKEAPQTATQEASVQSIPDTPSKTSSPSPDLSEIETVVMPDGKTWMKRNLNVETEESWCYENSPDSCEKYGRLYTWKAAREACAGLGGGWRLPTNKEWSVMTNAVGGNAYSGVPAGTDEYGFSALPGGNRWPGGGFYGAGDYGYWWTATEFDASYAYFRDMNYHLPVRVRGLVLGHHKGNGFSVRCLRD